MSNRIQILLFILSLAGCTGNDMNQQRTAYPQPTVERESILGIWWSPDMFQTAAFQINDSTIYYPDSFEERKYELKNDTLFVHLSDGTVLGSFIVRITADTLILSTFGQKEVFTRAETQLP